MAGDVSRGTPRGRGYWPRAMDPRLLALFFLSGATGLVYETVWGRELHLVFGTSQFAIATVLAAFMTGLAVGGWLASRYVGRLTRPLRVYALLEVGVGVFALAFPAIRAAIEPVYLAFWHATDPGPVGFGMFQFLLVGFALLVPTACMGATLPVLTRHVAPSPEEAGRTVGTLYGTNTFGAVLGVWLVGFFLLPGLGVRITTVLAALANFALAFVAWRMSREVPDVPPVPARAEAPVPRALLAIAALAGMSSLAMEVTWFRLLTLVFGASVYAFSVMLLAFLVGIAGGGHLGGRIADRLGARAVVGVAWAQLAVAALGWGVMWVWPELPITFVRVFFVIRPMPELLWPAKCVIAMLVMVPGAIGMGATFPLLVRAASQGDLARPVGRLYAANTVGSLVGAFSAGFWLLPNLRITGTALLCVCLNGIAAAIAGTSARKWPLVAAGLATGLVWIHPPPWEPMLMTSGVYKYVDNLDEPTWKELRDLMIDRYQLLFYDEGLSSVVTVARNRTTGNQWLANNGKIDASTTADMPTQVLCAHTPMLFTEGKARNALLIGLASGITLGALTLHRELEHIDVVELEPRMPEAAALFKMWNHDALSDPRVRILGNDGRNQLLLTPPGTYDLIVAEPSNPWLTGVSNLFTREFFAMGRQRLTPGGIWSQWVQMYGMDARDLQSIMRTFAEAFPNVLVFSTIRDADLVMIGSERPIHVTTELARALVDKNVGVSSELAYVGVMDEYDLLSHYLFDRDVILDMTGNVPLNTDDNLLVEYSAPKNLHRETSTENFLLLLPHAQAPLASIPDAAGLVRLAEAYHWHEDVVRALIALKEAERREPGREDVYRLYRTYQKELKDQIGP
jgi:spermidine synthase